MSDEEKLRYFLKQVTATLHETRQRLQETEAAAEEPIAIVGMGCRFPGGARSPEDLWDLVVSGADTVSALPQDRGWEGAGAAPVQSGNFVYDATEFDPGFFGISPREAAAMDPQQRLLLEVAWEALERSGIDPAALRGTSTGVFAGASFAGYGWFSSSEAGLDGHLMTGNATSILSGRISYTLGLEGPAVTVDTACSSALVALHLAVQALRARECALGLVGGAYVASMPVLFTDFSQHLGLTTDGRCKAFAATADGMGVAEGAGVLVVERLSDARRNGHQVLAVVRGSAINQDGASNGLTAPNGPSQQRVIRAALANARLSTADVDVVEAHGTGTPLGDPIEAQALLATYGQDRTEDKPLWLGSVKSNIGHAQQAAGVAGMIKMVQALRNRVLPGTLHADDPSPHIDWSAGNVRLLGESLPWTVEGRPRRAGVSGFGMSGTNVHVIVEEAPAPEDAEEPEAPAAPAVLSGSGVSAWPVSGRSSAGLVGQAGRLREFALAHPEISPADVAWSLATTRSAFEDRAVVVGAGREELAAGLAAVATGQSAGNVVSGVAGSPGPGRTVFVFPGQGSQWAGMGRELLESSPVFAARLDECAEALAPFVDWSLRDVLAGAEGAPPLESADVVQPALWAVMVSLAAVWNAAGVTPEAVVGHSQGEIAAACVAGILSLEDAARVVALRGKALVGLGIAGGMLSVVMPADKVTELLEPWSGTLALAAVNGPATTVVSGDPDALTELEKELSRRKILRWRVPASDFVAHSAAVDPVEAELRRDLAGIRPEAGSAGFYSTVHGRWMDGPELDAGYWFENVRRTVRFQDAVTELAGSGYRAFVEVSAQPVLTASITETFETLQTAGSLVTGTLHREDPGAAGLLASFGRAYVAGLAVDWAKVLPAGRRVDLPTYAFQNQRYWLQPGAVSEESRTEGSAAEAAFWAAVEDGDVHQVADTLAVDDERLAELLPALASWRRKERVDSVVADWRYKVTWAPVADQGPTVLSGTWLVVTPDEASADECVRALTGRGAETVVIGAETDRAAMAGRLAGLGTEFAGVLSLLALDETPLDGFPAVPAGLAGTLALVQALGDTGIDAPLWAVTRGAVSTGRADALTSPAQAQVWGLGRVAGLEHPDRWGGLIDLPAAWDDRTAARLCAILAGDGEDQVAIRAAGVMGRRLARAPQPSARDTRWTPRGTVLITGGTGALGGHLGPWLAERDTSRIVLSSRSGPAAPDVAAVAARLAGAGTRVDIVACDTAQRAEVAGLLDRIAAEGPPLSSVMHAALVFDDVAVDRLEVERLSRALAAKSDGARWLDELTQDLDLDAFVMYSSIAATWGAGHEPGYAAGNAYLDALADSRLARGLTATSIAYGPWASGGPAEAEARIQLARRGLTLLDPGLAIGVLAQALDGGEETITIADVDWERLAPAFTLRRRSPLIEGLPEVRRVLAEAAAEAEDASSELGSSSELAGRLAGLSRVEQDRLLVDLVCTEAASVLGHAAGVDVGQGRAFSDLGFDSLTSVELRNRLGTVTGLALPATLLFDYPTPVVLAGFLRDGLLGAVAEVPTAAPGAAMAVDEPVAIVSMGCRFPGGVGSPEDLWGLLASGGDAVGGFPTDRGWDPGLYDPDPDRIGASYVREGGFIHAASQFDAGFFGISPREALAMDPQQRMLLEVSWEALERAGIDPATLRGSSTGVFAGGAGSGYDSLGMQMALNGVDGIEGHLATGNAGSVMSGRVSYALGLEGPAVTVDTACSSSLVALHLAVQALRTGECDLALAGGVTMLAIPAVFIAFSRQRGLAVDGRCKAFAAEADGMGMGEGAGMLLLERLSDARRNGHQVLAVVRGSAINQDGASNGLTAPNGPSQQRVIRAALANARLTTADVDVVEAHGTGTPLGDPIEAQALLATYGQDHTEDKPLWLGSVKSNIGHTQSAAGVAGVIKMVMALRNGVLPKTLHADRPSPEIDWTAGEVRLLNEALPWTDEGRPRRAGVSAFGMSGTNAHVIVEEAPAEDEPAVVEGPEPTVLSASGVSAWPVSGRSSAGLVGQAGRLREFALAHPEISPADVAWSLATTRSTFEHRAVVVGAAREELAAGLAAVATGQSAGNVVSGVAGSSGPGRSVFVFPGQGSQWAGMGRELLGTSPVFAAKIDECAAALAPFVDWSLRDVLAGAEGAPALEAADVVQPALWAVMVSLAEVWRAAGVTPDAVIGHSQGEIAAACVAGILSLEDAARVVALRGKALVGLGIAGGMLSVVMPADKVAELLEPWNGALALAAVNGPATTVVSGDPDALTELERELSRRKVLRWRVPASDFVAHSAAVDPVEADLRRDLADVRPAPGQVAFFSTVHGRWMDGTELDAGYWFANVRQTVRFQDAVTELAGSGYRAFVEVSAQPVLTASITETLETIEAPSSLVTGTLQREDSGAAALLTSLGRAYAAGLTVDWTTVLPAGRPVGLPTYAFQHQRYWLQPVPVNAGDRDVSPSADWRYRVTWAPVPVPGATVLSGTWLVVTPDETLARNSVDALTERGAKTVVLEAGTDDRAALAARIAELGTELAGVLAVTAARADAVPALLLVQALGDAGVDAPLWIQTQGAVSTGPSDPLTDPLQAQVWGLGRVAALEHADRWGGLVDLPPAWDDRTAARLCAVLAGIDEDQVAIRAAGVMGRRLARAPQPSARDEQWTPGGTVLITGGTGALGGHVGRWLTGRDAARVVLTSRSGPAASGVAALAAELAGGGTDVEVVACDTARRTDVAGLVDRIAASGPPLSSVFHAAGVGQATPISETTVEQQEIITAAKATGATWLDELTQDLDLDAFVLFSSISATWGGGLQPSYGAANTFLDALAENRRSRGLAALSVAWGPWGGGGMTDEEGAEQMQRRGLRLMEPGRAIEALARSIDGGEETLTVADMDWRLFAPAFVLRRSSPLIEALPEVAQALAEAAAAEVPTADGAGQALTEKLSGLSRTEQNRVLTELVRSEAATVLGHRDADAVEPDWAFSDLGFDSLTSVELRNRLSAATGLRLPATLLFDHPNPAVLADYLWGEKFRDTAPLSLAAELDRLDAVLSGAEPDGELHDQVAARLQGFLTKWNDLKAESQGVSQKIESASDDEIFEFIHKELGRS